MIQASAGVQKRFERRNGAQIEAKPVDGSFSESPGFQALSKNAWVGLYNRKITKKRSPGTVRIQFLPVPGESGPK